MRRLNKFIIIITILIVNGILAENKPNWIYEIVSMKVENGSPDIFRIDVDRNRVSRGVYAISGTIDIKQDLTDDFHISGYCYFSVTGSNNFIKTPFRLPEMSLTTFAHNVYKPVFMNSLRECGENIEIIEDKFVAPLTKRLVTLKNCHISNERMPSFLKTGYYKVVFNCTQQVNVSGEFVSKVELI